MVLGWGQVTGPAPEVGFLSGHLPISAGLPSDFIISVHMHQVPVMGKALRSAWACGPGSYLTSCLISFRPELWADFGGSGAQDLQGLREMTQGV